MARVRPWVLAAVGTATLAVAVAAQAQLLNRAIPSDPVGITGGNVAGNALPSGVKAYLGIPFAAPPVAALRWREPQPVKPWRGVRHALAKSPMCMQTATPPSSANYWPQAMSEDCLYLNIWTPPGAKPGAKLPVIFWVYGGGFSTGSADAPREDGEALAKKGVIFVNANYRLGALGFMAHPELDDESPHHSSGAYGFLDQVAALRWIQDNVAKFGGDPGNVLVMGHSAGSVSASALHASPLAKGLFTKTMGVSASSLTWENGAFRTHQEGMASAISTLKSLGATTIAEARALPADRFIGVRTGSPPLDGYFMPKDPMLIFAANEQNDAAALVGFDRDEGYGPFVTVGTPQAYVQAAQQAYGAANAAKLLALYPPTGADWKLNAQLASRDITLGAAMRRWAMGQATPGRKPAYVYMFSRVPPAAPGQPPTTARHGTDVPYWLNTLDTLNRNFYSRAWTPLDRKLADTMSDMLVAFAKTGNPSTVAVTVPIYRSDNEKIVELGDKISIIPFPGRDNVALLHSLHKAPGRAQASQ